MGKRKIVDVVLYDTDKAEIIYVEPNKRRTYYMTDHRRFFVVYKTGELVPKTEEDIRKLLGEYDVDKYLEIFGDIEEA